MTKLVVAHMPLHILCTCIMTFARFLYSKWLKGGTCTLFDILSLDVISLQITGLPQTVTGRYCHSLSAVMMGPQRVWLIVVGGYTKRELRDVGGVKQWTNMFTDVNSLTVVIELGKQLHVVLSSTTYYNSWLFLFSCNDQIAKIRSIKIKDVLIKDHCTT